MLRSALVALTLVAVTPGLAGAQSGPTPEAAPVTDLKSKLAVTTVSFDFADTPLPEAAQFLAKLIGVNIVLGHGARERVMENDLRVSLNLQAVPATTALKLLCDVTQLQWRVQDGVVMLHAGGYDSSPPTTLRTYDLRDLLIAPRDHEAPFRDLFNALTTDNAGEEWEHDYPLHPEELEELIRGTVDPEGWDAPNASISQLHGSLLVKTSSENHKAIHALLNDLRAIRNLRVAVEVKVVDVAASVARDLRTSMEHAPALSAQGEATLAAALAGDDAVVLSRGTISGANTQQVALREGTQVRVALPTGSPTAEAMLHDGLTAQVRPVLIGGRNAAHVRARLQYTGGHAGADAHLRLDTITVDTALLAPLGAWVLAGGGSRGATVGGTKPTRETLVLMRVTSPNEQPAPTSYGTAPAEHAAADALRNTLRGVQVTCDFADAPLRQVLAFLTTQTKVNMVIGPEIFDERPEAAVRVTLQVGDLTALDVVNLVAQLTSLRAQVHADHLYFSTNTRIADTAVAVYDLRDLLQPSVYAPPHNPDLSAAPGDPEPDNQDRWEPVTSDNLADLIREAVDPESWDTPPNSLEAKPGFIVARNAPSVLAEVDALVRRLRANTHRAVLVEAMFLDVSEHAWKSNGFGRVLTAEQANRLATQAGSGAKDLLLTAVGRVTGFNDQRFSIHSGRQLASFDKSGPLYAADGVVLDVLPVISGDGSEVHCDIDIRRRRAPAAGGLRPGLPAQELRTHLKVPAGGAVALGAFAVPGKPGSLLVLRVTPTK